MQAATTQDLSPRAPVMDYRAGKYLSFHVGPEEFAIGVLGVREIMGMQDVTAVPHTPVYVKGIINLRGKVVPVVDLRLKFGMPATEYDRPHLHRFVVDVSGEGGSVLMGVIVDSVSEVVNIAGGEIENAPDFGEEVNIPYLIGIASKGKVKLLLNIEKVLTVSEVTELGKLLN